MTASLAVLNQLKLIDMVSLLQKMTDNYGDMFVYYLDYSANDY